MPPMSTCDSPTNVQLKADCHVDARGSLQHLQNQRPGRQQVKEMHLETYYNAVSQFKPKTVWASTHTLRASSLAG